MSNILILSSSELKRDPRILRQIRALVKDYKIYTCGLNESELNGVVKEYPILFRPAKNQSTFKRIINFLKYFFRLYDKMTWNNSVFSELDVREYDVIIVNDPREMSLAQKLISGKSSNAKIYFDLHEWFVELNENPIINNLFKSLTDKYYNKAHIMSTVSEEIATFYESRYGTKPYIVANAGKYYDLTPTKSDEMDIRIVHHGALRRARKIEEMIDLMGYLDPRFSLDFYLVGTDEKYLSELKIRAKKSGKINFKEPVTFDEIIPTLYQYDMGLFILAPDIVSYKYALPNKIFEFIQARLALAISPNPSMKALVEEHGVGVVSEDYTATTLAKKINNLSKEDIDNLKQNSDNAAKVLNEDKGMLTIKSIIKQLLES